jgi:hypothetical protein
MLGDFMSMPLPALHRRRIGISPRMSLALLIAAGATMQAGWLLLWSVSHAARVMADVTDIWSADPTGPLARLLSLIVTIGRHFPETGPLGGLGVAPNLAIALVIVGAGYLVAIVALDRGPSGSMGAKRTVIGFMLLFQLTLLLMPGIFSTDVFSYLIYGQLAGVHGLNPYVVPPAFLAGNPLLEWIYPDWQALPSPYGPLWTAITAAMAPWLESLDVSDQVLVHKLSMNAVHLTNVALLAWLLKRSLAEHAHGARLTAFTIFAWNPLLLLEVAGNGHNDGLMLTLLLAGLVPIARRRSMIRRAARNVDWLASTLMIALSWLIKYATLLVSIVCLVVWARQLNDWRARVAWLGGSLALIIGIATAMFWPWLAGAQVFGPAFDEVSGKFAFHSLPVVVQRLIGDWLPTVTDLDADAAGRLAQAIVYGLCRAVFVVYVVFELIGVWSNRDRRPPLEVVSAVSARILLMLLLVVLTEVHSWYFTWPLALVPFLGWRSGLTKLVVGYTLTCLPVDYIALFDWNATLPLPVRMMLGFGYLIIPLIVPAVLVARRSPLLARRSRLFPQQQKVTELGIRLQPEAWLSKRYD